MTENRFTPFDQVEYMERLERMRMDHMHEETFEEMVERIAKAWKEEPCPPEEGPFCNPDLHNWDTAHEDDKAFARDAVRFVLQQAGLG